MATHVTAGARLYAQERRRSEWLEASMEVTRCLLAVSEEEPLGAIAHAVNKLAGADFTLVVLPTADHGSLMVEVAVGGGTEKLLGYVFAAEKSISGGVVAGCDAIVIEDARAHPHNPALRSMSSVAQVGPLMAVPLLGDGGARGVLVMARRVGGPTFDELDLELAVSFAGHAAVALELAEARAHHQRLALLEDRHRIAADLHDVVLQRLFATGMSMQAVATAVGGEQAARLEGLVADTDVTIRRLREAIHDLSDEGPTVAPRS